MVLLAPPWCLSAGLCLDGLSDHQFVWFVPQPVVSWFLWADLWLNCRGKGQFSSLSLTCLQDTTSPFVLALAIANSSDQAEKWTLHELKWNVIFSQGLNCQKHNRYWDHLSWHWHCPGVCEPIAQPNCACVQGGKCHLLSHQKVCPLFVVC